VIHGAHVVVYAKNAKAERRRLPSLASSIVALCISMAGCGGSHAGGASPLAEAGAVGQGSISGGSSDSAISGPPMDAAATVTDATATVDGATTVDSGEAGASSEAGTIWLPSSSTPIHFHWQLSDTFKNPGDVIPGQGPIVYDIDGENNDAATVAALHALGSNVKVVCYIDVGTYEPGRSDSSQFPSAVLGAGVSGWPGEKWLDVRAQATLLPIMQARLTSWCKDKGFDGVEPDNLDAWTNNPGFPVTEADNVSYDLAIASAAHALGLSVGVEKF